MKIFNLVIATFSNIFFAFSQWFILIIIVKFDNIDSAGYYTFALSITAPIFLFFSLQLNNLYITNSNDNHKFKDYFITRIFMLIFASCCVIILIVFLNIGKITILILILVSLIKFINGISDLLISVPQKFNNIIFFSLSKISKGIITIVGLVIGYYFFDSLIIGLIITILLYIVLILPIEFYVSNKNEDLKNWIPNNYSTYKDIIRISFPLGIIATLDTLNVNIPRYFINYQYGVAELGYFSSIQNFIIIGGTIIAALGQLYIPQLANHFQINKLAYRKLSMKLVLFSMLIGFIGIIIAILFGKIILRLIYNEEFVQYYDLLILVMSTGFFWYVSSILGFMLLAQKIYKEQVIIYLLMILVTLGSISVFNILWGINGIVFSIGLGYLTRLIMSLYYLLRKERIYND